MTRPAAAMALLLGLGWLLSCCALTSRNEIEVDTKEEYLAPRLRKTRDPVILIPGTLGSRLYNEKTGEIAWGSFSAVVSELSDDLDLPIDGPTLADNRDDLQAYRVLDRAEVLEDEGSGEISFYAEIIDFLTETLGYRAAFGERYHQNHDLFVFFYDWRRSNVEAAAQLAAMIENIRRDLRQPDMKFTLLAVSNGGLIARYFLRYGGEDVVSNRPVDAPLPEVPGGAACVNRLICLGTPQTGSLDALHLMHEGYAPASFAKRHPPRTIFSFPAAFELLPPRGEKTFVGEGGTTLPADLWKPETWEDYGISVFSQDEQEELRYQFVSQYNYGRDPEELFREEMKARKRHLRRSLVHAERFHRAIAGPAEVPVSVIAGCTTPTLARVGLVRDGETWELIFEPRYSWGRLDALSESLFAMGDGVVTRRSALGLAMPQSDKTLREAGERFRASLKSWALTGFSHREMFEDELLRITLAEELSAP